MMARKLFAAALALTLPLVAAAQTPPPAEPTPPAAKPAAAPPPAVQLYGTLNVNLQYTEASGATAPAVNVKPRFAISTDSSNVGVRGTLKLNDTVSAVYQCETSANIEGEGVSGICNRNSRVGVSGDFGTIAYGNWDTPMKAGHYGTKADDPFGNTDVFGFQGIMGSPGYGSRTSNFSNGPAAPVTASFDQRGANSVIYWSPKVSGLSARVQASVDELRSADGRVDPLLLGVVVNYDAGPLSVFGTSEYHEDAFGIRSINSSNSGNSAAKDLAWRVGAGYELPLGVGALTVTGWLEQLSYKQDDATAGFKDYSRLAWLLGAKFRTGEHEVRARYTMALAPDITAADGTTLAGNAEDDLGAQQIAVGYAYHLAKSTQLYAFFTQIMNEDRARYTFGVAGAAAVVGANTPVGSEPLAVGLGMRHAF